MRCWVSPSDNSDTVEAVKDTLEAEEADTRSSSPLRLDSPQPGPSGGDQSGQAPGPSTSGVVTRINLGSGVILTGVSAHADHLDELEAGQTLLPHKNHGPGGCEAQQRCVLHHKDNLDEEWSLRKLNRAEVFNF